MSRKIVIMAIGTGGHVFPGLAVAHRLQADDWQVHWLSTPDRMEAGLVPSMVFQSNSLIFVVYAIMV